MDEECILQPQLALTSPAPISSYMHFFNLKQTFRVNQSLLSEAESGLPTIKTKPHRILWSAKPISNTDTPLLFSATQNRPSRPSPDKASTDYTKTYFDRFYATECHPLGKTRGSTQEPTKDCTSVFGEYCKTAHHKKRPTVSTDILLVDFRAIAQSSCKRINYQKGGGGGAFKRKQGIITGSTLNTNDPYSSTDTGISSYVKFLRKREDKAGKAKAENSNGLQKIHGRNHSEMALENCGKDTKVQEGSKNVEIVGNAWFTLSKETSAPKCSVNNKAIKPQPVVLNPCAKSPLKFDPDLKSAIKVNPIELKPKAVELNAPEDMKVIKSTLLRDMKKQILQELMQINNIPASYFLLGKNAGKHSETVGLEEVVDLVEISTNSEGDIVIRPKNSNIRNVIHNLPKSSPESECKRAIMVKKVRINPIRRHTSNIRSTKRQHLTPLKGSTEPLKGKAIPPTREVTFSTTLPSPLKLRVHKKPAQNIYKTEKVRQARSVPPKSSPEKTPVKKKQKVKVWHEPDDHLSTNHPINVAIKCINEFSAARLKCKSESGANTNIVLALGRKLGLGLTKAQVNNPEFFKSKESMCTLKEKLLNYLYGILNKENEITSNQIYNGGYCKAYIANGNNPMMVKSVLKQRWWWTTADSIENAHLVWTQWKKASFIEALPCVIGPSAGSSTDQPDITLQKFQPIRMCNHVEGNVHLGNKKALFYNMKAYYEAMKKDPFEAIPLTYHIVQGVNDPQFDKFAEEYLNIKYKGDAENVWIVKPGENSNRGHGISICKTLPEIKGIVSDSYDLKRTYIVQKYIENPLLINKRKFDIRCYGLVTAFNGYVKGYFYKEGYLRTASKEFSLKNPSSKIVHLTNEAVQQKYDEFGKFEPGNKMTYTDLNKYLESSYPDMQIDFYTDLLPQIKRLVTDTMRATHGKLDSFGRKQTFEVFGYDFMIDDSFHVYLIEANINPCLEIKSPVTARIVPGMLDSAFRIAIDPIFQPPHDACCGKKSTGSDILPEIKHELVYDSRLDCKELEGLLKNQQQIILELDDEQNEEECEGTPLSNK